MTFDGRICAVCSSQMDVDENPGGTTCDWCLEVTEDDDEDR